MTAIETIALVIVAISVIKMAVLMVNPQSWFNFAGKLMSQGAGTTIVLLALGIIVLKYLLVELNIVQIYAVFAFTIIFFWLSLSSYRQRIYETIVNEIRADNIWRKSWLVLIIWIVLSVWVLKEIFA